MIITQQHVQIVHALHYTVRLSTPRTITFMKMITIAIFIVPIQVDYGVHTTAMIMMKANNIIGITFSMI